ncbi:MAG: hypothetical protein KDI13_01955 [Alphaproteobacteria bacterium]|nr:hypothetical protein [Alphaproteobacteria bacterium]
MCGLESKVKTFVFTVLMSVALISPAKAFIDNNEKIAFCSPSYSHIKKIYLSFDSDMPDQDLQVWQAVYRDVISRYIDVFANENAPHDGASLRVSHWFGFNALATMCGV